jgi:sialate O-acetylesterase
MSRSSVKILIGIVACLTILFAVQCAYAEEAAPKPFLHELFTDHMVLQRGIPIPIWGWTEPGKVVVVRLGGKSVSAVAGADGKWMAKLPPFRAGGPYTLTVDGPQKSTVSDVMIGDVWICSGQSNMEMGINGVKNAADEIAQADYPKIRLFNVAHRIALTPQETATGAWEVCTPDALGKANFSAAAYFFGRKLNRDLNVPIGLIQTAWGGTMAEAWTSAEALSTMDDYRQRVAEFTAWVNDPSRPTYAQKMQPWWKENDPAASSVPGWEDPSTDTSDWKSMKIPQYWQYAGMPDVHGIVWFTKEIDVPADWAGKETTLSLGPIDDMDTTWVNGVNVGGLYDCSSLRVYPVPAGVLKPGRNVIAIRVLDTGGLGGIYGQPEQMFLQPSGSSDAPKIPLAGDWKYRVSVELAKTKPVPVRDNGDNPNSLSVLYNGMISPLVNYGIKGAIWYQGEGNADRPMQYRTLLPTMINDWRSRFGEGRFPFFIVQLAGFMDPVESPVESGWAELREAQLLTAENTPNCGLAVAIDIGEAKDIHPKDKQDVGLRLALAAEGIAYKQKIEYSGPIYDKMKIEGKTIRLYFRHVGGGLTAKGEEKLRGFAIAGPDKKFVWADATIDGKTIVLSAPGVDNPTAARYDWANFPNGNLYNKADLPASPFRTDVD